MKKFNFTIGIILLACVSLMLIPGIGECEWPTKQVNIVVTFAAGGTTDRVARALAPYLEKELQVPVIIVNREGGGSVVGIKSHLKNDPDDGSFLVYGVEPYVSAGVINNAYQLKDLEYFGMTNRSPQGLWVNKASKYKSAKDLFNAMKAGEKITSAVIIGGWSRAGVALLDKSIGSKTKQIPYKGGGANQRMSVVKQETDYAVSDFYGTATAAGEDLRCLGVFADERLSDYPDVPTINEVMKEMGLEAINPLYNFRFLMVKKSFREKHPDLWEVMDKAIANAIQNKGYIENMAKQNIKIAWKDSQQTKKLILSTDKILQEYAEFWKR